jgi:hypothetical protein
MIRKAIIIESILFGAAGFLVLASVFLIGFTAYEGLRFFQYTTPLAFFTGTTWNPNLLTAEEPTTTEPTTTESIAVESPATESYGTTVSSEEGGQLLQGDQFIDPSAPEEGTEASTLAAEGQLLQGDQFIEPSAAEESTASEAATPAAEGQFLQGDQFIEPSAGEGRGARLQLLLSEFSSPGGGQHQGRAPARNRADRPFRLRQVHLPARP